MRCTLLLVLPALACAISLPAAEPPLDPVALAPDAHSFIHVETKTPFTPWGLNYGPKDALLEDFWDTDWPRVEKDFRDMKALGANVIRVHLQYGKFMAAPDRPIPAALAQLSRLLHLAEDTRLYLDITGLASYRPADAPAWYDSLDEAARWQTQEKFWAAIAGTCAQSPAVFCYDLMNEPIVPGEKRTAGDWRSGKLLGGFDYVQFIVLDRGARAREDLAAEWCRRMAAAVRTRDHTHLITVGLLPWVRQWGHLSGFFPEKIAPVVDFLSVHLYPDSKDLAEARESLQHFVIGKPIVIEETFPLSCSAKELEDFLLASRAQACGWMGHYDGLSLDASAARKKAGTLTLGQSLYRQWLQLFIKLKPQLAPN